MLLALDTATRQAGLALYDGAGVRAEVLWHASLHHTEWLAPTLDDALRRIGATAAELTVVAATVGPGSFTGLRVALSLAKGIAAARDLPLLGIPSLAVTAYPHQGAGLPLCVTLPAGRGRHAYAFFPAHADVLAEMPLALADVRNLARVIQQEAGTGAMIVVGEWSAAERTQLHEALSERVHLASPALSVRRPAVLAELAWGRWQRGESDDLHTLEPLYLHLPATGSGGNAEDTEMTERAHSS